MSRRGVAPQKEDAADRAMRRMQAFDQSDNSDEDNATFDNNTRNANNTKLGKKRFQQDDDSDEDESEEDDEEEEDEEEDEDQEDEELGELESEGEEDEEEEDEDEDSNSDSDDDSDQDSDASDDSDDSDDDRKLKELQKNLSQIPFEKLAEIQQKLGMKVFHQTLRGSEKKKVPTKGISRKSAVVGSDDDDEESEDEDDDDSEGEGHENRSKNDKMSKLLAMGKEKRVRKKVERRDDKNKPMEIGSKKPVGRYRQVVETGAAKRRDPRFDSLSGTLDTDLFEKSYGFINEYRDDEMKQLKITINKERDPELKTKMQDELSRMQDKKATEDAFKRKRELKRDHKRKEKELIIKGKNPFFLKKSDQKKLELIDKFKHLEKNPKALAKAMEKRRKRNSAKEKTKILGVKRRRTD